MNTKTDQSGQPLLILSALLWVVWGLVHMFAGVITIVKDTPLAVQGIADGVDLSSFDAVYPAAAGAIINQHGFNLLWIGLVTVVCAVFIWKRSGAAILLAALVGGLADVGYFIFIDLGGFAKFAPGTVMTLVSSAAIIASFYVYFTALKKI